MAASLTRTKKTLAFSFIRTFIPLGSLVWNHTGLPSLLEQAERLLINDVGNAESIPTVALTAGLDTKSS